MGDVKLSVLCPTYNHERYIRAALDGFVMQKTDFPFEVIVCDDASTDKTPEIIREYQQKYPDIIKPIYQTENQYSKGKDPIIDFMADKIRGEYVAVNEGDDYWTDKHKLQKQVDFLEAHPDFSICFHPVKVHYENACRRDDFFPKPKNRFHKKILTLSDLLKENFIQTNSVVYRWRRDAADLWPGKAFRPGDWFLHLLHAQVGKIAFLPNVMAVYRRHDRGVWDQSDTAAFSLKNDLLQLVFFTEIEKRFSCDKSKEICECARRLTFAALKLGRMDVLNELHADFPNALKKAFAENKEEQLKLKNKKLRRIITVLGAGAFALLVFSSFFILRGLL